ncbi:MAG: beta-glucosidase BglX [Haloarculaceae archaeon]
MDRDCGPLDLVSAERRERIEDRIESLLEEMTLEEKVGQLTQVNADFATGTPVGGLDEREGAASGQLGSLLNAGSLEDARRYQEAAVEESRLGIPLVLGLDVIHGYRTVFPVPLAEAASFDPDLVEAAASVAATEAAAAGVHWTFAPSVDVSRDPRWGRVMEAAGEDPTLGSAMARARVRGFQGEDPTAVDSILACAKHYVGYGASEAGREYNTVDLSETRLREVHLPPFRAAAEAGAATFMSSFNVHERVPATGNERLLDDLLRGDLGYEGMVVSDWNAVGELVEHGSAADLAEAGRQAIEAGLDMDMVSGAYAEHLADLVRAGEVEETAVDRAVERVLAIKGALGLFEDPYQYFDEERADERILAAEHRETAREVARESQVLLENDGTLPLSADDDVALVGELADGPEEMLGAWRAEGDPDDAVTLRETLAERHGDAVTYAPGATPEGEVSDDRLAGAVEAARGADVVVAAVGEPAEWSGEGASRARIDLPGEQRGLLERLVETGTPVVAVVFSGRPLALTWTAEHVPAVVQSWFPGVEAGPALADVLYGADPGGRLPMSVPRTEGQIPVYHSQLTTGRPAPEDLDTSEPPADPGEKYVSRYIDCPNAPLYPFGHGETYGEVTYRSVALDAEAIDRDGELTVTATVENEADRPATEVVQVYVRDRVGSRARPERELKGFEKVRLDAGESRTVELTLTADDLAFWTADEEWTAEPGTFDVLVGRSAEDVVFEGSFELIE